MFKKLCAAFVLSLLGATVHAEEPKKLLVVADCVNDPVKAFEWFGREYNETPKALGDLLLTATTEEKTLNLKVKFVLLNNEETGSYSLIAVGADGGTCLLASGEKLIFIDKKKIKIKM